MGNSKILLLFLLSCQFIENSLQEETEDVQVVFASVIVRHGDRTPVNPYPNDPWRNLSFWPATDWGQLTDVGKRQLYSFGKSLRQRYNHLLSDRYDPTEIYIRSTDYDRTIMSAEACLAGLYPTTENTQWTPDLHWQPVPVHVTPKIYDDLLMQSDCPRFNFELSKLFNSKEFKEIDKELSPIYKYLTINTGSTVDTMKKVEYISDTLMIEELYNFTLPSWTKSVYPEPLKNISKWSFLPETFNKVLKKLRSGPFIKEITQNMIAASEGTLGEKIILYTAHDDVIVNILRSLNLYDYIPPTYAENILFELIMIREKYYIRIFYKETYLPIPLCGVNCDIQTWLDLYSWLIPNDHMADCKLQQEDLGAFVWKVSYIFATIVMVIVIAILILFRRKRNNSPDILSADGHSKRLYESIS